MRNTSIQPVTSRAYDRNPVKPAVQITNSDRHKQGVRAQHVYGIIHASIGHTVVRKPESLPLCGSQWHNHWPQNQKPFKLGGEPDESNQHNLSSDIAWPRQSSTSAKPGTLDSLWTFGADFVTARALTRRLPQLFQKPYVEMYLAPLRKTFSHARDPK